MSCATPFVGLLAVMVAPPSVDPLDFDVPGGHFYSQANGFNGAGATGFAVTDDDAAAFWSEFQRLGGVPRLGYPISTRFQYGGLITQAFQFAALQWRPDLGQAVTVAILDDLAQAGSDGWLERTRQVPPASAASQNGGLLDAYPALADFVQADPDPLDDFGAPVAVKDYGSVVGVRLQRAALQLWTVDEPWASAGTVTVANAGELAREAGLWPISALAPGVPLTIASSVPTSTSTAPQPETAAP